MRCELCNHEGGGWDFRQTAPAICRYCWDNMNHMFTEEQLEALAYMFIRRRENLEKRNG